MATEQFVTFGKFNDRAIALELTAVLQMNEVEYLLEDTSSSLVPILGDSELTKEFRIKLRKEDFERADSLLKEISLTQIEKIDSDYYLFDFTDEELMEIITKRDEWNQFDFLLAQKLLKERGKEIKPEVVELLKKQRIAELAKPEESQKTWIYAGYILAFLGGFIGIFIGWHLLSHKKTLPNGDRVYGYSTSDRKHGYRIFIIGVLFLAVWLAVKILTSDY